MNFLPIDSFSINTYGKVKNLSCEIYNNEYIKLIYYHTSKEKVYEYYIYPPKCSNISVELNTFTSVKINISNLFERMTNTYYYISLSNLPLEFGKVIIDNLVLNNNTLIDYRIGGETIFYFISENYNIAKNYRILYNISIRETYSSSCEITLTINACYNSCKNCTKNATYSNYEEHNCIQCKDGFYPFLDNSTTINCFTEEDVINNHSNWYFDKTNHFFAECNSNCETCYGPNSDNCLSCHNNTYLYNNECIISCPNKSFPNSSNISENCFPTCESCHEVGDPYNEKCDSCSIDKITYLYNCYEVFNSTEKSFYSPIDSSITSCYQYHGKYIKENTNQCIDIIEEGYYISNIITGVLSKCSTNCKTCSLNVQKDIII